MPKDKEVPDIEYRAHDIHANGTKAQNQKLFQDVQDQLNKRKASARPANTRVDAHIKP